MRVKLDTDEVWLEAEGEEVWLLVEGVRLWVESREDAIRLFFGSRGRDLWSGDGRPREKGGKSKRKGRTDEPKSLPEVRGIPSKKKKGCQTKGSREKLSRSLRRFHARKRREEMKILRQVGESLKPRNLPARSNLSN